MFCFCSTPAQVILLMYVRVIYPYGLSASATRFKNCPRNSSGSRWLDVKSINVWFISLSGYPSYFKAVIMWLSSPFWLVCVDGKLRIKVLGLPILG